MPTTSTEKASWKDRVWIVWLTIHTFVILRKPPSHPLCPLPPNEFNTQDSVVDAVPYYPEDLRIPPTSPLHFLERLRNFYIETFNDPIVQWTPELGHDNWIPLFFHIEMLFLLPVCMYTVYTQAFGNRKASFTGPEELLYLVYAFVTAFTTLVCLNDVFYWDDILYPAQAKNVFLFQLYGPWVVIRESPFLILYLVVF